MRVKLYFFFFLGCLWYPLMNSSRPPRSLWVVTLNIKGFDNCTSDGQFKWTNTKMRFGKNSQAVFSGQLHLGFPLTDDGTTPVKMTTYVLQNGGYKMLFKSEDKSVFAILHRLSPKTLEGLLQCFETTEHYFAPGDYNCSNWHMDPIKTILPLPFTYKAKAFATMDFFRDNATAGCFKMLLEIS